MASTRRSIPLRTSPKTPCFMHSWTCPATCPHNRSQIVPPCKMSSPVPNFNFDVCPLGRKDSQPIDHQKTESTTTTCFNLTDLFTQLNSVPQCTGEIKKNSDSHPIDNQKTESNPSSAINLDDLFAQLSSITQTGALPSKTQNSVLDMASMLTNLHSLPKTEITPEILDTVINMLTLICTDIKTELSDCAVTKIIDRCLNKMIHLITTHLDQLMNMKDICSVMTTISQINESIKTFYEEIGEEEWNNFRCVINNYSSDPTKEHVLKDIIIMYQELEKDQDINKFQLSVIKIVPAILARYNYESCQQEKIVKDI